MGVKLISRVFGFEAVCDSIHIVVSVNLFERWVVTSLNSTYRTTCVGGAIECELSKISAMSSFESLLKLRFSSFFVPFI